MSDRFAW